MPEFRLDLGTHESHSIYDALPDFTRGYIEAAFFCGVNLPEGETDESGAFGLDDLTPDALAEMVGDCAAFAAAHAADLAKLDGSSPRCSPSYDMESAGRDYWFTRNGHGVGYWDREFEGEAADAADRITAACRYSETYLFATDSGEVETDGGGYVEAGRAILAALADDPAAIPAADSRYGAPMGSNAPAVDPGTREALPMRRVTLDPGGYDAGGRYWGLGDPLWRVTAPDGCESYARAGDKAAALAAFREQFPAAAIRAA